MLTTSAATANGTAVSSQVRVSSRAEDAGVTLIDARQVRFDRLAAYDRRFFPEPRDAFLAIWVALPERVSAVALRDGVGGVARNASR